MAVHTNTYIGYTIRDNFEEYISDMMDNCTKTNGTIFAIDENYIWKVLYRGRVVKKIRHYNSSMDMEYYSAICIDYDENGKVEYKEVSGDVEVDASPEEIKAYNDHLAYLERKNYLVRKRSERKAHASDAKILHTTMWDAIKLHNVTGDKYYAIVKLMKSFHNGKLRSEFRKSLAIQVDNWIKGERKYKYPLSPKQMSYLGEYKPW